jgi:predicted RNA binding protein YcfA (HicA-like mRNA interferase family)
MPVKIRELKSMLMKAGFVYRHGKGRHTVWEHKKIDHHIVLSGNDGDDAKKYQEKLVKDVLLQLEEIK